MFSSIRIFLILAVVTVLVGPIAWAGNYTGNSTETGASDKDADKHSKLTGVRLEQNKGEIRLHVDVSGRTIFKTARTGSKLVIYLENCDHAPGTYSIDGDGHYLSSIRWSMHEDSGQTWVVLDTRGRGDYRIEAATGGIVVVFFGDDRKGKATLSGPAFMAQAGPLPGFVVNRLAKSNCKTDPDKLAYVVMSHWGPDGRVHPGEMIVARDLAPEVVEIFAELFTAGFPIQRMQLLEDFGSPEDSAHANNTAALICGNLENPGRAIDLNPEFGAYINDKGEGPPGVIVPGGKEHKAFTSRGWTLERGGDEVLQRFVKP